MEIFNDYAEVVDSSPIIILYCEFTSKRAPAMYPLALPLLIPLRIQLIRELDRRLNHDNFPDLHFPQIYLLEGGYKKYYQENKNSLDSLDNLDS